MTAPRRAGGEPHTAKQPAHQRETASHRRAAPAIPPGAGGPRRRGVVLLGNTTKLPSAIAADERKARRAIRFGLRDYLHNITTIRRVAACGRHRVAKETAPSIRLNDDAANGRVAHYAGVQLCGAVHFCPVCGPRIRQARADDIDAGSAVWLERHGVGSVMMLTATMPHDAGEPLAGNLETVAESFGATVSGRGWQNDKRIFGLKHYIVAHDATHGINGWHPHLHVLLFGARALGPLELELLRDSIYERWARAVVNRGHREPSREHGIVLEQARNRVDVARYISQVVAGGDDDRRAKPVALELARGDLKTSRMPGHRTPWEILADLGARRAAEGEWTPALDAADDRDRALWREWETVMPGVKAIRWSKGLRAAVRLEDEKSDEEIVNADIGGEQLFLFPNDGSWTVVVRTKGGRVELLRAAEVGGAPAVVKRLRRMCAAWLARRGDKDNPLRNKVTTLADLLRARARGSG